MTYKDYVKKTDPNRVYNKAMGGVEGCPGSAIKGGPTISICKCDPSDKNCAKCWDMKIPEELIPEEK